VKVVLFCGGRGVRLGGEGSKSVPKPLVRVGQRPILWHVMKYYAHYGHKDFILCVGYKADQIKRFFVEYDEWVTNDFTLTNGGERIELARRDIEDWRITFVDTGIDVPVGQRLRAVRDLLGGEEVFLANYSDGVTDLHLPDMVEHFHASGAMASFLTVRPHHSLHVVRAAEDGRIERIEAMSTSDTWINGGFFVLKREIFEYLHEGEELVVEPFERLIARRALASYRHTGFWASMDTFKDKLMLEGLQAEGRAPWHVWEP
jgi:glucose-1-phosphate cytidylyltransferase